MSCKHTTYIDRNGLIHCLPCDALFPNKPLARHQFPAPEIVRAGSKGWLVGWSPSKVEWVVYEPHKIGPQRDRLSELHAREAARAAHARQEVSATR